MTRALEVNTRRTRAPVHLQSCARVQRETFAFTLVAPLCASAAREPMPRSCLFRPPLVLPRAHVPPLSARVRLK